MQDFSFWVTKTSQLNGKHAIVGIPIFAPSESDGAPFLNDYCGPLYAVTASVCKPLGKRQIQTRLSERTGFFWECSTLDDFPQGEFLLTSKQQRVIYDGPARIDSASNLFLTKKHPCNAFSLNGLFCIVHDNSGPWFKSWFKKPSNVFSLIVFGIHSEQLNKHSCLELFRLREYSDDPIVKVADVYLVIDNSSA